MSEVICHCPACQQPLGLYVAVVRHHGEKGDDRCWMDDDTLYAAAGLPVCDRRVGDKEEMLFNCERFLLRRCEASAHPRNAELEAESADLREGLAKAKHCIHAILALRDHLRECHDCEEHSGEDAYRCDEGGELETAYTQTLKRFLFHPLEDV